MDADHRLQVCRHEQSGEGEQRMSRIGSVSTLAGSMNIPALEVGVSLVHNMPGLTEPHSVFVQVFVPSHVGCMVLPLLTQQQWSTWRCSYFYLSKPINKCCTNWRSL
ncbi:uncharacterized protein [Miscanthus floridulus]|uniref:uncharacterized protein isoform X3 n=1 Tax=Miscanthus floridulus TaxID=154761 RepID=UPI003459DCD8